MHKFFASAVVVAALCGIASAQADTTETALQSQQSLRQNPRDLKPTVISVSHPVTYADLDLSKASDAAELHRRVTNMAIAVCDKLHSRYPVAVYPGREDSNCVKASSDQAMASIHRAVNLAANR